MRDFHATPELCPTKKDLTPGGSSRYPRINGVVASADLARRRFLTAIAAAPVISFPAAAAERHLGDGDDTAIFRAYDAWQGARKASHALELSHDSSNEYDAVCDAAWVVETEAGKRLAELPAATPQGAAAQLRWLLSRLNAGALPAGDGTAVGAAGNAAGRYGGDVVHSPFLGDLILAASTGGGIHRATTCCGFLPPRALFICVLRKITLLTGFICAIRK